MEQETFDTIYKYAQQVANKEMNKDYFLEHILIPVLSTEDEAVPLFLEVLNRQITTKKNIMQEMNHELSRAEVFLADPKQLANSGLDFALDNIKKFYQKWTGIFGVGHCYKKDFDKK
jgi:hypothetical protein